MGARLAGLAAALWLCGIAAASADGLTVFRIRPSEVDPSVAQFDEPNVVMFGPGAGPDAQLAIFLPGSGGRPQNVMPLLGTIAGQGYRVIGLEYDDEPSVVQVCSHNPDPRCSESFREERIYGNQAGAPVENAPQNAIVPRLVALLRYLVREYPGEHWDRYLSGDAPYWNRIAVSGLSQGAGMAAYIAKRSPVARVVLFSSPWDFQGPPPKLAPWIAGPSVTPPDRWYAELHRREKTAALIAQAYRQLAIPDDHIMVFDLDLPEGKAAGDNPFHGSTVHLEGYVPQWKMLYGVSP